MSRTARFPTTRALRWAAFTLLLADVLVALLAIRNRWFVTATTWKYAGLIFDILALWFGRLAAVVASVFAVMKRIKPTAAAALRRKAGGTLRGQILPTLRSRRTLAIVTPLLLLSLGPLIVLARRQPPFLPPGSALALMPPISNQWDQQYLPLLYAAAPERHAILVYNRDRIQLPEETINVGNPLRPGAPTCLAVAPTRRELYATDTNSNGLLVIDRLRRTERIPVGLNPRWLAVTPDERKVYVSAEQPIPDGGRISVVDLVHRRVIREITKVNCPEGLAVSPDGRRLYVATQCGAGQDPLLVIDTGSDEVIASSRGHGVGIMPLVSPKGDVVYVALQKPDRIWVVATRGNREVASIPIRDGISAMAVTPDGKYLLVGGGAGITILDTTSHATVNTVSVPMPGAIAVSSGYGAYVWLGETQSLFLFGLRGLVERTIAVPSRQHQLIA